MPDFITKLQELGPLKYVQEWLQPFIMELAIFTATIPLIWQVLAVGAWSMIPFIESDVGVAIGIAVGVPVVPATIAAIAGNWVAVMAVILLTDKIRQRLYRNKDTSEKKVRGKKYEKVMRAVQKWGVPGASLLAPTLVGTHITAFFMAASGVDKKYLMFWQTIAITVWGIIFGVVMSIAMAAIKG